MPAPARRAAATESPDGGLATAHGDPREPPRPDPLWISIDCPRVQAGLCLRSVANRNARTVVLPWSSMRSKRRFRVGGGLDCAWRAHWQMLRASLVAGNIAVWESSGKSPKASVADHAIPGTARGDGFAVPGSPALTTANQRCQSHHSVAWIARIFTYCSGPERRSTLSVTWSIAPIIPERSTRFWTVWSAMTSTMAETKRSP